MKLKFDLKEKAIDLRRRGFSYSEILKDIPVAKSTLSLWLRLVGLSTKQKQRLIDKKLQSAIKGANIRRQMRIIKLGKIKSEAHLEVADLIKDPFWLTGVILYWAEGSKEKIWSRSGRLTFTNMDCEALKIFQFWAQKYLSLTKADLKYEIYIHQNNDWGLARSFWANQLNLAPAQFRVYFKKTKSKTVRKNTGALYNGVMRISAAKSTDIVRKVAGWIEGVVEYINKFGG